MRDVAFQSLRVLVAVIVTVLVSGACVQLSRQGIAVAVPLPVSPAVESRTVDYAVPERAGRLSYPAVDSIGGRVRTLRATPTAITVTVGDTLRLPDVLRVIALDSAGTILGELPGYDFGFSGRGMRLLADGRFVFTRTGTMRFTARFPEHAWRGKASDQPTVHVPIIVRDDM
jgi:hypothetical protein